MSGRGRDDWHWRERIVGRKHNWTPAENGIFNGIQQSLVAVESENCTEEAASRRVDVLLRVIASGVAGPLKSYWQRLLGFRKIARSLSCGHAIAERRCPRDKMTYELCGDLSPYRDHGELWICRTGRVFICHEYDCVTAVDVAMDEFCKRHDLTWRRISLSWHFYGNTTMILVYREPFWANLPWVRERAARDEAAMRSLRPPAKESES